MTVIRSPIRPVIFSPIRQPTTLYKGGGLPWYPNRLFQSGDILLWYDPSDLSTMFTDLAGIQPVTADGDSVALMLDKGQWGGKTLEQVLAAQPELVSNTGGPYVDTTGWVAGFLLVDGTISVSSGLLVMTRGASDGASSRFVLPITGLTIGRLYEVVAGAVGGTGSLAALSISGNSAGTGAIATLYSAGSRFFIATATTMYAVLGHSGSVGQTATLASASVKEVPGYHRIQATGTSMPKYKTGPNPAAAEASPELVTNGTFDTDTGWAHAGSAIASGLLTVTRTSGFAYGASASFSVTNNRVYLITGQARRNSGTGNTTVQVRAAIGGTQLEAFSPTDTSGLANFAFLYTASATQDVQIWCGVANANAVIDFDNISVKEIPASAPYIHWLLYDGTDDGHATGTITWGTDEVAACAGVTKSSDAVTGVFVAFGTSGGTIGVNGEQGLILAPGSSSATTYYTRFLGTATPSPAVATGYAAPHTGVVSIRAKIATDLQSISVNGDTEVLGSGDMGTGNLGTAMPLYFGRRGGSSLPFNGREYQTVIRSRLLSAAELSSLETFVAAKTGVVL